MIVLKQGELACAPPVGVEMDCGQLFYDNS